MGCDSTETGLWVQDIILKYAPKKCEMNAYIANFW